MPSSESLTCSHDHPLAAAGDHLDPTTCQGGHTCPCSGFRAASQSREHGAPSERTAQCGVGRGSQPGPGLSSEPRKCRCLAADLLWPCALCATVAETSAGGSRSGAGLATAPRPAALCPHTKSTHHLCSRSPLQAHTLSRETRAKAVLVEQMELLGYRKLPRSLKPCDRQCESCRRAHRSGFLKRTRKEPCGSCRCEGCGRGAADASHPSLPRAQQREQSPVSRASLRSSGQRARHRQGRVGSAEVCISATGFCLPSPPPALDILRRLLEACSFSAQIPCSPWTALWVAWLSGLDGGTGSWPGHLNTERKQVHK